MPGEDDLIECPVCRGTGRIAASQAPAARRSASMRQSIARRKADGRPVGRGPAPDRAPRDTAGYFDAWEPGGTRRGDSAEPGDSSHARQREARRNASRYTRAELLRIAADAGIPGAAGMSRDQLAMAVFQRNITLPPKAP
jgi:hypothetical protein